MTYLQRTGHLTVGYSPQVESNIACTHTGQAYFAGTGPYGAACGECRYWLGTPRKKAARCAKFKDLTLSNGPAVPRDAMACKYFDWGSVESCPTKRSPRVMIRGREMVRWTRITRITKHRINAQQLSAAFHSGGVP